MEHSPILNIHGCLPFYEHLLAPGNGTPLQYSCLENPMDGGAWWAAVRGVAKSRTWLHFHFSLSCVGEGNGNPLQWSCLENTRDGGAWWAAVYGVARSQTRLKWLSNNSSWPRALSSCSQQGLLATVLCGLLAAVVPLVAEHRLQGSQASVVLAHGLSCSTHVGSSCTRDQTSVPCIGRRIHNYWTTREVFSISFSRELQWQVQFL